MTVSTSTDVEEPSVAPTSGARREVPARILAVAAGMLVLLTATIVVGTARERGGLPVAAGALRTAVGSTAGLLSCFEGVQDDLFGGLADGQRATAASRALAAASLDRCDVDRVAERVVAIAIPPAAPLTDAAHRTIRANLVAARDALLRAVLDARSTWAAMQTALGAADARPADVATGYRAVASGYEAANDRLTAVEARLWQLEHGRGGLPPPD